MDSHSDVGYGSRFDAPVTRWTDICIWFQWRDAQQEAVIAFGGDSIVEVGCYWDAACVHWPNWSAGGKRHHPHRGRLLPRQWTRGSARHTDAHRAAVLHGGGTMAGLLHRNVIACGFTDTVQLLISSRSRLRFCSKMIR
jgi:hypothetical protein